MYGAAHAPTARHFAYNGPEASFYLTFFLEIDSFEEQLAETAISNIKCPPL